MRTLSEFIKESARGLSEYIKQQLVCEAYDQCAESWDELVKFINTQRKQTSEYYDAVYKLIEKIINKDDFYAVYDKDSAVFKISRYYVNNVDELFANGNVKIDDYEFSCHKGGGSDRTIYCETVHNSSNQHIKVFALGTGSIGKIKTEEQEQATVSIWNYLVEHSDNHILDDEENRYSIIKKEVTDLTEGMKKDITWIKSCVSQIEQIRTFLIENQKIDPEHIKNFRAIRYGYKDPENKSNVAQAHEAFLKKYLELIQKENNFDKIPQKDNYDPSDVLIYDSTKGDAIASIFTELADVSLTDVGKVFDTYKKLFDGKYLFGISLKKISHNPSFELFNIDRSGETIKNYVCSIKSVSKCDKTGNENGAYAIVEGKFKFEGIADPSTTKNSNDKIEDLKTKMLKVSMRTFGSGTIGLDIAETKGPALGKVPVNIWRNVLDVDKHTNLQTCLDKFIEVFGNTNKPKNKKKAEEIIVGGVKNGPWCLPFVLVH